MTDYSQLTQITPPNGEKKILMHSCCAPCACEIMERIIHSGIQLTIFFYNPNIHPRQEYEIRKQENIRFAEKLKIPFIDADYDRDNWFKRAKGMEYEPERGRRCSICFDMRFEHTALYAKKNGFKIWTSSLGLSRWKDMDQINQSGIRISSRYPGLIYWTHNWRKQGGSQRMYDISKEEQFYQQEYCGCVYSLRDTNLWRIKNNKQRINLGTKFYEVNSPKLLTPP